MNKFILSEEIQEFITSNIGADVAKLALQKNKFPAADWTTILNQIAAKQKAKTKLPIWSNTSNIYYPSKISVEQTSSEKTAEYKSKLVSGTSLIDLTGGFGVDAYYFSIRVNQVTHCEINTELSEIVAHNFEQFQVKNVRCLAGDSSEILATLNQKFDWIYIDPSRRNDAKGKVFMLNDCLPNIPELLDFYFRFADKIMVKTAPILDISAGLSELKNAKEIHIVAIENEVKELLWVLEKNYSKEIQITTCNLAKGISEEFTFKYGSSSISNYSLPKKYLFEPNAANMKSGGFDEITSHFEVEKLHQHSHLYTSDSLIDFPGRVFEIENCFEYNKQNMKSFLENKKANITTRNFPETVENIRKKWKIKDGGNTYCFFTTDANNAKIVLLCSKLK
ncbi:class I SAM-dependent methyltransferase [Flavobacterium paronense]|uniref:Class I SAM-dependent methyltransferase n=1 Tax=Flavobacterium paronense TaxID=1392775 RepID=A0ABV5GA54_9FLAO|nr:class I SAM-dependent methyltransferase [Flavobacterium paronense]MDN3677334.1 class I SAM-dependent methyltransferase [Flavobacterium paronense]